MAWNRWGVVGAGVVVVAVGAIALWRALMPASAPTEPVKPSDVPVSLASPLLDVSTHGVQAVIGAIATSVEPAALKAGVPAPGELRLALERSLAAHLAKDPALFVTTLADQGTDPGRFASPDSGTHDRWSSSTRLVREGRFDAAPSVVRRRLVGGKDRVAPSGNVMSAARDHARPWLDQIPENQRQSVEVVIAGELVDGDGGRFRGSVGYEFMWAPARRAWALYRFHVYDYPTGRLGTTPPV